VIRWALGMSIGMAIGGAVGSIVLHRGAVVLLFPILFVCTALEITRDVPTEFPVSSRAHRRADCVRAASGVGVRAMSERSSLSARLRQLATEAQLVIDELVAQGLSTNVAHVMQRRDASEAAARARDALALAAGALEREYVAYTMPTPKLPALLPAGGAA
jgi:hypothetical protein